MGASKKQGENVESRLSTVNEHAVSQSNTQSNTPNTAADMTYGNTNWDYVRTNRRSSVAGGKCTTQFADGDTVFVDLGKSLKLGKIVSSRPGGYMVTRDDKPGADARFYMTAFIKIDMQIKTKNNPNGTHKRCPKCDTKQPIGDIIGGKCSKCPKERRRLANQHLIDRFIRASLYCQNS